MGLGGRRGGAASETEVAPAEDAVMALLDLLVDPLLPAGVSSLSEDPPSPAQQATLAKQVQAVAFLYDYYHRKRNPGLEFLDFISFCKLAVVLKPSLLKYMKVMQMPDHSKSADLEKDISLMEKMVMEACDITKGLETLGTSEDVMTGWPISKVAIFLVDCRKENCLLLHSSITLGVWSVIEKEYSLGLSTGAEEKRSTVKRRITKKPHRENKCVDEDGLQQLAFAAVKDAFVLALFSFGERGCIVECFFRSLLCGGCSQSSLKALESHTVYSLSKEKTAARFYIVQCIESNIKSNYLPIRDIIDSMRGPLLKKEACSWSATSVVEYFHVLPYADVISNWFVRNQACVASHEAGLEERNNKKLTTDQSDVGRKMDTCDKVAFLDTTVAEPAVTIVYKKRNNSQKRSFSGEDHVPDEMNIQPVPTTDPVKKEVIDGLQSINEQNREYLKTEDKVVSSSAHDHNLVPFGSDPNGFDKIREIISSKGSSLMQTACKVLLKKRDMLCLQLRNTQNEIALCDKNRDTILRGGSDALAVTLYMLIEGCNDANVSNPVSATEQAYHHVKEQNSIDYLKRKRPLEANLSVQNPCQELNQMCSQNNWALPIYHVSKLEAGGGHQCHVEVTGMDFKLSVTGHVCTTPNEAKESATALVVSKLCYIMASAS